MIEWIKKPLFLPLIFIIGWFFLSSVQNTAGYEEEGRKSNGNKMVTMDFDNVDIKLIARYISELTDKNFIVDDNVRGRGTIFCPTKIPVDEALKVFESLLEVNGYTTVEAGNSLKIIRLRHARTKAVEARISKDLITVDREDKIVTQVVPLKYADANEIKKLFRPLVSRRSHIGAYPATNTLIITDMSSNIHRLMKIIEEIDVAGSMAMAKIIQLEYASAEILSGELLPLFNSKERRRKTRRRRRRKITITTDAPVKIIPDKRTNTLIILANSHVVNEITDLIKKLDKPISRSKSKIHVYYLENASSEDLAGLLSKLPSKRRLRKGRSPALGDNVIISVDNTTNSLIIAASPQDYAVLKKIIKKLDIMNEQVLIEALIAEVSINMSKELGIEWRVPELSDNGEVTLYGGTSLPLDSEGTGGIDQLTINPYGASPSGLFLGALKGTMEFGGTEFLNIGALIRAFQANSEINILSTPHILTMDNEEAEIVVGEERPFLVSSQSIDTGGITKTFEYNDLGVTLRIIPQISQGETVNLEILLEIKNFMKEIDVGAINTTKRLAKTTVLVEDGAMIVIGGLIRDDMRKGLSQVPCLGNIPIMGWFFKAFYQQDSKTNLMIFITPHIIETPEDLRRITEDKRSLRKNKKPFEQK